MSERKKKTSKNSKYYLEPEDLKRALTASQNNGQLTNECLEMLQLMIRKQMSSFRYSDSQDKEDVEARTTYIVLLRWKEFDVNAKTNAFSFFTKVIYNAIYASWNKLYKNKKRTCSYSNVFVEQT